MGKIMTVLGEIKASELGFTDMHEHTLFDGSNYNKAYKNLYPEIDDRFLKVSSENLYYLKKGYCFLSHESMVLDDVNLAVEEIGYYKASGGSAITDVSPGGIRGSIEGIRRISEKTGVHIIASTGFYADGFWPEQCVDMQLDEMKEYMRQEIYDGIDGTNIRAGQIKIACNKLNEREVTALKAASQVSKETGLALQVHTGAYLELDSTQKMIDIAVGEGADPEKLIMCHMDSYIKEYNLLELVRNHSMACQLTLDPLRRILDNGVTVGFDCFGCSWDKEVLNGINPTDYDRVSGLYSLICEGYSSQIVLGSELFVKFSYRRDGGNGYPRVPDYVVPVLK